MDYTPLKVMPEAAAALGKSVAEIEELTLGEFRELAYYKGFDVRVTGFNIRVDQGRGSLTVRMDDEQRPILYVG